MPDWILDTVIVFSAFFGLLGIIKAVFEAIIEKPRNTSAVLALVSREIKFTSKMVFAALCMLTLLGLLLYVGVYVVDLLPFCDGSSIPDRETTIVGSWLLGLS